MDGYVKQWSEQYGNIQKRIEELEKVAVLPQDKEMIKAIKENGVLYAAGFNKVINNIKAGKIKTTQEANVAVGEVKDETHKMEAMAKDLADAASKRMNTRNADEED